MCSICERASNRCVNRPVLRRSSVLPPRKVRRTPRQRTAACRLSVRDAPGVLGSPCARRVAFVTCMYCEPRGICSAWRLRAILAERVCACGSESRSLRLSTTSRQRVMAAQPGGSLAVVTTRASSWRLGQPCRPRSASRTDALSAPSPRHRRAVSTGFQAAPAAR